MINPTLVVMFCNFIIYYIHTINPIYYIIQRRLQKWKPESVQTQMSPDCPVHHIQEVRFSRKTLEEIKKRNKNTQTNSQKKIFKNTHKREYTILLLRLIWCTMIIEKPKYINYKFSFFHLCKKTVLLSR